MPVKRKNVHVPLEPELHARLVAQARRVRSPVTVVAREAIAAWTVEQELQAERDAIRAYAEAMAGSQDDLDEALEEAAAELRAAPE
jgi:predicted transcriptional regulator